MAKRFTCTEIWDKEWFMELTPTLKCLVKYVREKSDLCGVWSPNYRLASLYIADKVTEEDLLSIDNGRQFKKISDNRIFCLGFVEFQYVSLSLESRVHLKIIEKAKQNGVYDLIKHLVVERSNSVGAKRNRITEKINKEIFSEDEYNCQYCGGHFTYDELCLDHIVAISNGGDNEKENLTTSCRSCNSKKWQFDVFEFLEKNKIKPLDSLSKKLNTLSKKLDTLKEEEQDKEEEQEEVMEQEKSKVKEKQKTKKLFKDSEYFDIDILRDALEKSKPPYCEAHVGYYYEAMELWSRQNNEKKIDWFATCQNWILRDITASKFKDKNYNPNKNGINNNNSKTNYTNGATPFDGMSKR